MAQYEQGETIIGDDLYVMSDQAVYVSSDKPNYQVWTIDTLGLHVNGAFNFFHDIDIDTTEKVWLATANGIYTQLLASPQWNKVPGYVSPAGFTGPEKVFVDRMQRIWVAEGPSVYVSTDGGGSFQQASGGGSLPTTDFGDDAFGNIYVIKQGKSVYYSAGGTQPFTRIDLPLVPDLVHFGANSSVYNEINGDTTIELATVGGIYTSSDQGASWSYPNLIPAGSAFDVAATADHRLLMTTNTGFYRKDTDTTWTKLFPSGNIHLAGMKVFTDASGAIYHTGEVAYSDQSNGNFLVVRKSTDNGNSFAIDTLGAKAAGVYMGTFFIDESGVQHAAATPFITGTGVVPKVWSKEPGQAWTLDTAGLSFVTGLGFNASFRCMGSDNAGNIYLVVLNNNNSLNLVYRRPLAGGTWVQDGSMGGIVSQITGRAGKLIAATTNGVQQYNAGTWTVIPSPSGLSNPESWAADVSPSGIIWASYEAFDAANNASYGKGVWYTTDGLTWKYPQPNVDTSLFQKIVPIGDSVFVLGRNFEGIYTGDTSTILGIRTEGDHSAAMHVKAVPNPFNGTTTIVFSLEDPAMVSLDVYDSEGALVYSTPARKLESGEQRMTVTLDQADQPGLLIYSLQVGEKKFSGKLFRQ